MARQGAITRDPKQVKSGGDVSFKYGENKAAYDALNPQQQERYRRILANKGTKSALEYLGKTSGQQVVMPGSRKPTAAPGAQGTTPFSEMTPQQQLNQIGDVTGSLYGQMAGYSQQYNPATFQQQYEPQFNQAMDRARQSVMTQFEQRNAQSFAKERQDFETAMANKGVAPGGEQYNRELQALTDRQDRARQEAMNAAEQAAQSVQAQGYQQATGVAMMPGEIAGQYQAPFMAQGQLALGQQYAKELAALENKYRLQQIKATPRGGGGGGQQPDYFSQYYYGTYLPNQYAQGGQQQPNPWASFGQGIGVGAGAAATNSLLK